MLALIHNLQYCLNCWSAPGSWLPVRYESPKLGGPVGDIDGGGGGLTARAGGGGGLHTPAGLKDRN